MTKFSITMKRMITATVILLIFFCGITFAQSERPGNDKMAREKIEAQKAAFITSELDLTTQESRDFWPIYDEFQMKKKKIYKTHKDKCLSLNERIDSLSLPQQEQLADCPITFEQQLLDLKKEYHAKYKKVIPPLKLAKLYKAERDFKMMLMRQMRENKGFRPGPGSNPKDKKPCGDHHEGQGGHEEPGGHEGLMDLD